MESSLTVSIAVTVRCAPHAPSGGGHHEPDWGTSCGFLRPLLDRALFSHRHLGFLCCPRSRGPRHGWKRNSPSGVVGSWGNLDGGWDLVEALCGHAGLHISNSCSLLL